MLTISNQVIEWSGVSESELMQEIALMLYQKGKLTFGQAAQTAGLNYAEFQFLLGRNRIPVHYGVEELLEDLVVIKQLGQANGSN